MAIQNLLRSPRRFWLYRLVAVGCGLAPLLVFELLLAGLGLGRSEQVADPFVGFDGQRPLFVLNAPGDRYEIARSRQLFFQPDTFRASKADNEFRVFCLGGSTVQGRPYAIETSFSTWFELSLQAADPQRTFDVVNCGGISYASYRLVPILREVLQYRPDLIVLYTGHNEFLEDRSYEHIKRRSPVTNALLQQAAKSRTFNMLWAQANRWRSKQQPQGAKPRLPVDVEARLDYVGSLALYHRDLAWQAKVVEHFEYNLRRMIRMCQTAQVPIWIVNPVCNLRSTPPFKSEHRADLSSEQLDQLRGLRGRASELYRTDLPLATRLLEQAASIDDLHAGLAYDLAKCYESMGLYERAAAEYLRAKELDVCPLRITEPLRRVILTAARETNVPLIDVDALIRAKSRHGIPGGYLLVDHVHPSISGHQMIAELMIRRAVADGIVKLAPRWVEWRDQAYSQHLATLDDKYYLQAQRRLEGLRQWAAGRTTHTRDSPVLPLE